MYLVVLFRAHIRTICWLDVPHSRDQEHTRLINKILNKNRQMNYLPPAEPLEFKLDVYTRVGKDGDGRPIQLWQQLDGCSCGVYSTLH